MCQECADALKFELDKRGWRPSHEDINAFLWNCTCFPFGSAAPQTHELFNKFGNLSSWDEFLSVTMEYSERKLDSAMFCISWEDWLEEFAETLDDIEAAAALELYK